MKQTARRFWWFLMTCMVFTLGLLAGPGCAIPSEGEDLGELSQAWTSQEMLVPIIKGPVYASAPAVWLLGVQSDTVARLYSGAELLAEGPAVNGGAILSPNRAMIPGEQLVAHVVWNNTVIGDPSEKVAVLPVPQNLPRLDVFPVQFVGGQCILASGGIPGGKAFAASGAENLGSCVLSISGTCTVSLLRPLRSTDSLQLWYELNGTASPRTDVIRPTSPGGPSPYERKLAAPVVVEPISACQSTVHLTNLTPGAKLNLSVDYVPMGSKCTPMTSNSMSIPRDLVEQEGVRVTQQLAGLLESDMGLGTVEAVKNMDPPQLFAPLYEGDRGIRMGGVLEESSLEVLVDGHVTGATDGPQDDLLLPVKLKKGQVVQLRLTLCGEVLKSNEVTVLPAPTSVPAPKLRTPIYEGSHFVSVTNRAAGARVQVFVDGYLVGEAEADHIPTFFLLQTGQKVTASQTVGNLVSPLSTAVVVQALARVPAPVLGSLVDSCVPEASLSGLLPGSHVVFMAGGTLLGDGDATETQKTFPLSLTPTPGWSTIGKQSLGARSSVSSNAVIATGAMSVTTADGYGATTIRWVGDRDPEVQVRHCFMPGRLPAATTFSLATTSSSIVEVEEPTQVTVPATAINTPAVFTARARTPGKATLIATAANYRLTKLDWKTPDDGLNVTVEGRLTMDPSSIRMTAGGTRSITVTAQPRPSNGVVYLSSDWSAKVSVPSSVTIPYGQNTAVFQVSALGEAEDVTIKAKRDYYESATTLVSVDPGAVTQEHYDSFVPVTCPWEGKCWAKGNVFPVAPVLDGTLTAYGNPTTNRDYWFPNSGVTNDEACDPEKGTIIPPQGQVAAPNVSIYGEHEVLFVACCVPFTSCSTDVESLMFRIYYDVQH